MNVESRRSGLGELWTGLFSRVHWPPVRLSELQERFGLPKWGRLRLPGFRFAETMSGTAYLNGEKKNMVFHLTAEAPDLREYLHSGRTHIAGDVTIQGLSRKAPLRGDLWIHLLGRRIRYEFTFRDDEKRLLTFNGQKDLQLLHPVHTLKNLPGHIRDEHGHEVARAKLHFRTRDLPAFVRSFRPMY